MTPESREKRDKSLIDKMTLSEAYQNGIRMGRLKVENIVLEGRIMEEYPKRDVDYRLQFEIKPLMTRKEEVKREMNTIPRPQGILENLAYFTGFITV